MAKKISYWGSFTKPRGQDFDHFDHLPTPRGQAWTFY